MGGVPLLVDSPGNPFAFSENRFSCFALGALEHELPSHLQQMRQAPPIWDDALLSSRPACILMLGLPLGLDDNLDGIFGVSDELEAQPCFRQTEPMSNHLMHMHSVSMN